MNTPNRKEIERLFGLVEAYASKDCQTKKEEDAVLAGVRIFKQVVMDLNRIANAMDTERNSNAR